MKRAILISLFIILSGCSLFQQKPPILVDRVVRIDPRALESCSDLLKLSPQASFEELLEVSINNMGLYNDCKLKQDNSIKLIKELSNTKEPAK